MSQRKSLVFTAVAAVAALTLFAFTRPAPTAWEYHVVRGAGIDLSAPADEQNKQVAGIEAMLNQLGNDGWELQVVQGSFAVLRRPR